MWIATLSDAFSRIALFGVDGTTAYVTRVKGLSETLVGTTIPLTNQTPLRWAIEAASPIVGAGRSPSGEIMAQLLGIAPPRAFAVVPLISGKKFAGLAYGDCGSLALPFASVAEIFAACERLLEPETTAEEPASSERRRKGRMPYAPTAAAAVFAIASLVFTLAPLPAGNVNERVVTLPYGASAYDVGKALAEAKLVRSAAVFAGLSHFAGASELRAGTYRVATGLWPGQVAVAMRRGERDLLDVTIPEGLTLAQVGKRIEAAGVAKADIFIAAAHAPALLTHYGIRGADAQGWLASGPYAMARGIGATDAVRVMIDRFIGALSGFPEARHLDANALNDVITLASIVEREAKDKTESARIAGLFANRLRLGMRLESRATVLYVLGTEKKELTLADTRQPSPYNTYLNAGLPPAPIVSPSVGAIRAVLHPEEHGYLYMTDRDDGSGQHVFSTTYEEHLKAQRENR